MLIDPSRNVPWLGALVLAASLGCGSGEPSPTAPAPSPGDPPPSPTPPTSVGLVLARGELGLPGALQEGDPGSHEELVVRTSLPDEIEASSGHLLVLSLRDATRPGQTCPSDEPEDGCATIDWSADPTRPRVPPDGRFANQLELELVAGRRTLYLSRTLRLNDVPDLIDPQREHTAIPGLPTEWQWLLPAALEPETTLELRITMTKWRAPDVRIGFEVRLLEEE